MDLIPSNQILPPALGASGLIESAGKIFTTFLAPINPDITQNIMLIKFHRQNNYNLFHLKHGNIKILNKQAGVPSGMLKIIPIVEPTTNQYGKLAV